MENRHGLVVDTRLTLATGTAGNARPALEMVAARPGTYRITLGADKAYDCGRVCRRSAGAQCDAACRAEHHEPAFCDRRFERPATPAMRSAGRGAQAHSGGVWLDQGGRPFRKTRHRGLARVGWMFTLNAIAYNLVRLPKLVAVVA